MKAIKADTIILLKKGNDIVPVATTKSKLIKEDVHVVKDLIEQCQRNQNPEED
jgi:hypothetical protein